MYTAVLSPADVRRKVTMFNKKMKEDIKENILSLLREQDNEIVPKRDHFMYFPSVYSDNEECIISSLQKISISKSGDSIVLNTSGVLSPKRMSINKLSVHELTQVWQIAINGVKKGK